MVPESLFSFDLRMSNVNDSNIDEMNEDIVPDVVLVKKVFADKATRNARRRWKLKHLALDDDAGSQNRYERCIICILLFLNIVSSSSEFVEVRNSLSMRII